jgi:hypothetical protein
VKPCKLLDEKEANESILFSHEEISPPQESWYKCIKLYGSYFRIFC